MSRSLAAISIFNLFISWQILVAFPKCCQDSPRYEQVENHRSQRFHNIGDSSVICLYVETLFFIDFSPPSENNMVKLVTTYAQGTMQDHAPKKFHCHTSPESLSLLSLSRTLSSSHLYCLMSQNIRPVYCWV